MLFILGTWYLYLGVLRLAYGVRYAVSVLVSDAFPEQILMWKFVFLKGVSVLEFLMKSFGADVWLFLLRWVQWARKNSVINHNILDRKISQFKTIDLFSIFLHFHVKETAFSQFAFHKNNS